MLTAFDFITFLDNDLLTLISYLKIYKNIKMDLYLELYQWLVIVWQATCKEYINKPWLDWQVKMHWVVYSTGTWLRTWIAGSSEPERVSSRPTTGRTREGRNHEECGGDTEGSDLSPHRWLYVSTVRRLCRRNWKYFKKLRFLNWIEMNHEKATMTKLYLNDPVTMKLQNWPHQCLCSQKMCCKFFTVVQSDVVFDLVLWEQTFSLLSNI